MHTLISCHLSYLRGVFRTRAAKVEQALVSAGYHVVINEEKPRKGSFVIRVKGSEEEGGGEVKPIVELLDLKRPFKPLRELDIDALIQTILHTNTTTPTTTTTAVSNDSNNNQKVEEEEVVKEEVVVAVEEEKPAAKRRRRV
eukprot:scaffold3475_cov173-Ochromonas_danica.AAC.7